MPNLVTKLVGDKRRWRQYRARVHQLPPDYRTAVEGIQRYLMYFGALDADYRKGGYIEREQRRLIEAIDEAAGDL
ncbi:MAG: DUF1048 domain-containing protein [Candidatus Nanopelagicales bacterium]|nr:DUF1048 domain-containing protein [Candidatus Nanopelagicales bacterium]